MAKLLGKWKLVKSENFEDYMKEMGVNAPIRKLAVHMYPTCDIELDGDIFDIKMNVPVITIHEQRFKIGEPFENLLPNGSKQMTIAHLEGDSKIRFTEPDSTDNPHVVVREVVGDEMVMTCTKGSIKCTRVFKRLNEQ